MNGLAFYDWENTELIRRIEIQPKHVSFHSIVILGMFIFVMRSASLRPGSVLVPCPCLIVLHTVLFASELWYLNEAVNIGYFEKYF